jgi:hypothetical protein
MRGGAGLTNTQVKKIRQMEIAHNFCRYLTEPLIDNFVMNVSKQLQKQQNAAVEQQNASTGQSGDELATGTTSLTHVASEGGHHGGVRGAPGSDEALGANLTHKSGTEKRREGERG